MKSLSTLAVASALVAQGSASLTEEPSWISAVFDGLPSNPMDAGKAALDKVLSLVEDYQVKHPNGTASEYPYFNVFPQYRNSAVPGAGEVINFSWQYAN